MTRAARGVDWTEVRRRVEASARSLVEADEPSADRVRTVLEERARRLARRPEAPPAGDVIDVVTFSVAGETYAIEARLVVHVGALGSLALIPGVRPPLLGVTSWRGELLSMIDLRQALGLSATVRGDRVRVIIVGEERPVFAMPVDSLEGMRPLRTAELHAPAARKSPSSALLRGISADALQVLDSTILLQLIA